MQNINRNIQRNMIIPSIRITVHWERDFIDHETGYEYTFYVIYNHQPYNLACQCHGFNFHVKKQIEQEARKIWGEGVQLDFSLCPQY